MPVHNGGQFLRPAIESILRQTLKDFEFLILDDASEDDTAAIIASYQDPRIRCVRNEVCQGVAKSLNRGLDMIRTEYVVRMDADDISVRRRLEWQVHYMQRNPHIGVSGTWIKAFGDSTSSGRVEGLTEPSSIKSLMLFCNPLYHPSVILRKAWFDANRLRYDPTFNRCEDYDLWFRASPFFPIGNIHRVGLYWRKHFENVTVSHGGAMVEQVLQLQAYQLKKIGIKADRDELYFHYCLGAGKRLKSLTELKDAESWLARVRAAMLAASSFPDAGVHEAIGFVWFWLCAHSAPLSPWMINRYFTSDLRKGYHPSFRQWMIFFSSMMWHHVINRFKSIFSVSGRNPIV